MFYVAIRLIRSKWITVYSFKPNIYIGKFKPDIKSGLKHIFESYFLGLFLPECVKYFLEHIVIKIIMFLAVLSLLSLGQSFSLLKPGNLILSGRVKDQDNRCEITESEQNSRKTDWLVIKGKQAKNGELDECKRRESGNFCRLSTGFCEKSS